MRLTKRRSRTLSYLFVGAVIIGACDSGATTKPLTEVPRTSPLAAAPGFDGTTIHVAIVAPATGAAAPLGQPYIAGSRAYWSARNAKGGIAGRYRSSLDVVDSEVIESVAVFHYDNAVANAAIFEIVGTRNTIALLPRLARDGTVAVPSTFDARWIGESSLVPFGAPYEIQTINALAYALASTHEPVRVCLLAQRDDYGYGDAARAGLRYAAHAMHFSVATSTSVEILQLDFTASLDALSAAGCTHVVLGATPVHVATLFKQAAARRFTPRWIGLSPTWQASSTADPKLTSYMHDHFWLASESPAWSDGHGPGIATMRTDTARFANQPTPDPNFIAGYLQAQLADQILEHAINAGGLDRAHIRNAAKALGTVSFFGLAGDYHYGTSTLSREPPRTTAILGIDPAAPGGLITLDAHFSSDAARTYPIR